MRDFVDLAVIRLDLATFLREYSGAVVAVVAGTLSTEDRVYAEHAPEGGVSLAAVVDSLSRQGFRPRHVDPASESFLYDLQTADLVFINMHGEYGEDGRLQGMLDYLGKPYTGSGVLPGAVGLNKLAFKRVMSGCAVPVPRYGLVRQPGLQLGVNQIPMSQAQAPMMAKPVSGGSSIGIRVLGTQAAVLEATGEGDAASALLLEEYVPGAAVTVAVLNLAGQVVTSPPVRIAFDGLFYDADVKMGIESSGRSQYLPLEMTEAVEAAVCQTATTVHCMLGCRGYSRVDFIVTESGAHYVLEINTIPGLTRGGNFAACTQRLGLTYDETVLCILRSCLLPHPELL